MNRVDLSSQAANSPKKLFITTGSTEVQQKIIFTISLNLIHLLKPLYTILIYLKTCNWTVCNQISLYVDSTFHGTGVCLSSESIIIWKVQTRKKKPVNLCTSCEFPQVCLPCLMIMQSDNIELRGVGVTHKLKNIFAQVLHTTNLSLVNLASYFLI